MVTKEKKYKKVLIELRREQVLSLLSKGYTQKAIAKELGCSESLVNNDIKCLSSRAQESIKEFVYKTLPEEMQLSLTRLAMLIKEAWKDIDDPQTSKKDKHSAIQLVKECTALRLEILGSGILTNELNSNSQKQQQQQSFVCRQTAEEQQQQ